MLARFAPQGEHERMAIETAGLDSRHIYTAEELVSGEEVFFAATGITDGQLLDGVHYQDTLAETHSLVLRGETHTRRMIYAEHLIKS